MSGIVVGPVLVAILAGLGLLALTVLANLLEQAGPIRLRSWSEEAEGSLRELYQDRRAFDAFRYLLRGLETCCGLLFVVALVAIGGALEIDDPLRVAFLVGTLTVLVVEWASRHFVGVDPEAALARLSGGYLLLRWVLSPLLPWVAWTLPEPRTADNEDPDEASPDEIDAFIDVGRREGILEPDEGELLRGLVDFGDAQVRSVMTPRIDLVAAPVDGTTEQLMDLVLASGHSRLPLYRESIDGIVGILHVRDLLRVVREGGSAEDYLQPPHVVPETKSLTELLRELQERHQELAVVVDEYGGIEGVVTIEDLLEEIFGEIVDEHDEEESLDMVLPDGSWRVDGRLPLTDLCSLVGIPTPSVDYETVGGLVFDVLGRVPGVGDRVEAFGLGLEVEAADSRSARRVRVEILTDDEDRAAASVEAEVPGFSDEEDSILAPAGNQGEGR